MYVVIIRDSKAFPTVSIFNGYVQIHIAFRLDTCTCLPIIVGKARLVRLQASVIGSPTLGFSVLLFFYGGRTESFMPGDGILASNWYLHVNYIEHL